MRNRFVSPTERGQVTIPKEIRKKLRITPSTKLRAGPG
ncbi:MAG: AbrB/MazE/SpoVT family DNA-binding domain-containing protein [Bacillota bacterium]